MRLIAHRGNINGKSIHENQPQYILEALRHGFDVEVDVREYRGRLWLGHGSMDYLITDSFISEIAPSAWFHCKNLGALEYFSKRKNIEANYFWHQSDDYTVTSHGIIWAYPGKETSSRSVILLPEYFGYMIDKNAYGICTDFPIEIERMMNE